MTGTTAQAQDTATPTPPTSLPQCQSQGIGVCAQEATLKSVNANETQRKLNRIISQNGAYFAHLQRSCVCGICTCGKCRCNAPKSLTIELNGCNCSSYKATFTGAQMRQPNQSFKQREPMFQPVGNSSCTTYKNDYLQPDGATFKALQKEVFVPTQTKHSELTTEGAPDPKQSTYGENYIDFKVVLPRLVFRPSQVPTTDCRLPFIGHATNKEYGRFRSQDVIPMEDGRRFSVSQFKNPINVDVRLPGMNLSHSREVFQPFRKFEPVRMVCPVNELGPDALSGFKNQFKTSASLHKGRQNVVCPASVILRRSKVARLSQN